MVSPDGAQIAWVEGQTWKVWEANLDGSGARVVAKAPTSEGISQIAWTKYGFVVDSNFTLYLMRAGSKAVRLGPAGFVFAVGGRRVASGPERGPGQLVVDDLITHRQWRMGSKRINNSLAAISPDGARIAWTAGGAIWVARVGGVPHRLAAAAACPQWSPDGRTIAFVRVPAQLWAISALGGRGRLVAKLGGNCNDPGAPAWSRDSAELAVEPRGTEFGVADAHTGRLRLAPASLGRDAGGNVWGTSDLYAAMRPAAREAAQDNCTNLWRLDRRTLRGTIVVRGCQ
jgi:hypothetical protein